MEVTTQAMREIARFFVSQPSPEQIIAFHASHASPEVTAHLYALLAAEREERITDEERRELDSYETIEHIIICMKAEAWRRLRQDSDR